MLSKEIYLDLKLSIEQIMKNIFQNLFDDDIIIKKIYYRKKKKRTTKDILTFPDIELRNNLFIYSNLFFLEFNNKNLIEYYNKYCNEIGLEKDKTIFLKIDEMVLNLLKNDNTFLMNFIKKDKDDNHINEKNLNIINNDNPLLDNCIPNNINNNNDENINNNISFLFPVFENDLNENILKQFCYSFKLESKSKNNKTIKFSELIINKENENDGKNNFVFINNEKKIIENPELIKNSLQFRKINEGLNILGLCKNSKCSFFNEEIIYNTQLNNGLIFHFNEELKNIKCPKCQKIIISRGFVFWKCEFQIEGEKIEDGEAIKYKTEPEEAKDDNCKYFDPFKNGEILWTYLNVYVLPLQALRFNKN